MTKVTRKMKEGRAGVLRIRALSILAAAAVGLMCACGPAVQSTDSGSTEGAVSVSFTDAAAYGFSNVWITVKAIWFHTDDTVGPDQPAWLKYPVTPYSVDLLTLTNGAISPAIWDRIKLPEGTYKQIRIVLAGTTDALTESAVAHGLQYNNEVVDGTGANPLYIPDFSHGIRLAGTFTVVRSETLRLAVDFNAGEDIVDIRRKGVAEYFFKPRLAYFDLDDAGAITGTIDASAEAATPAAQFVFKAEAPNDDVAPQYHVVKRATVYDTTNHQFVLYPLPPGNYDVLMRGVGYETVIIKNVPVTKGTTPTAGATVIPTITMAMGTDYAVTADDGVLSPTGSWINFYQTLPLAGEVPYEVRFRHLNPWTGGFASFKLSNSPLRVGVYVDGTTAPSLTEYTPAEGAGGFSAVQDAILYQRSSPVAVNPTTNTDLAGAFLTPLVPSTPSANSITGNVFVPSLLQNHLDNGKLFVVFGGMILNTIDVSTLMPTGGAYTMGNLPGGLPRTIYGVEALGWSSTTSIVALAVPRLAILTTGDATGIDMNMVQVR